MIKCQEHNCDIAICECDRPKAARVGVIAKLASEDDDWKSRAETAQAQVAKLMEEAKAWEKCADNFVEGIQKQTVGPGIKAFAAYNELKAKGQG